jgi:hypothetical protein
MVSGTRSFPPREIGGGRIGSIVGEGRGSCVAGATGLPHPPVRLGSASHSIPTGGFVRFLVLGPLQVVTDRAAEVRGPQVGRLLAALLIDAGRVVKV